MQVAFVKMHGCGNDFVVMDERAWSLRLTQARAAAIADRKRGIGCDQLITLEPAPVGSVADVFMRIHNPDGSEAGSCGNATRCVAMLLTGEDGRARHIVRTTGGDLSCDVDEMGGIVVDMGQPKTDWREVPLAREMDTLHVELVGEGVSDPAAVSIGNPHATFFVDDLGAVPVERIGPLLERDALFPQRANIGFAQMRGRDAMRLRVWERGAGLTLACGSGASAAWVNAVRRGLADRKGTIDVDGGQLVIEWTEEGRVLMTGPATLAFRGIIDLSDFPP